MDSTKNNIGLDKFTLRFCIVIILSTDFAEIIAHVKTQSFHRDIFSTVIGLVAYTGIFFYSQHIIDNNLFKQITLASLIIFIICVIKQALTNYDVVPLFASSLPLFFICYFRLMTFLFYKHYPTLTKKPTIIFSTRYGKSYFNGLTQGYKPTVKEKVFSLFLFLGFIAFVLGLTTLIRSILI